MKPLGFLFTMAIASVALFALGDEAWADVCRQVRPGWSPEDGPVSMLGEAVTLLFSGGSLFLLLASALATKTRNFWFSTVVAGGWFIIAGVHYFITQNPVGIDVEARLQGCIGSPAIGIFLFFVFGVAMLAWQFFSPKKEITS